MGPPGPAVRRPTTSPTRTAYAQSQLDLESMADFDTIGDMPGFEDIAGDLSTPDTSEADPEADGSGDGGSDDDGGAPPTGDGRKPE